MVTSILVFCSSYVNAFPLQSAKASQNGTEMPEQAKPSHGALVEPEGPSQALNTSASQDTAEL